MKADRHDPLVEPTPTTQAPTSVPDRALLWLNVDNILTYMFYYARVTIIHALKLFLLRTGVVCDPARPASLSPLARSLPPSHVAPPCSRPPRHLNSDKTRRQQSPTGNARASLRSIALLRPAAHLQPNTADLLGPLFANSTQLELDMADRRSGHRGHHSPIRATALRHSTPPSSLWPGGAAPEPHCASRRRQRASWSHPSPSPLQPGSIVAHRLERPVVALVGTPMCGWSTTLTTATFG